MQTILTIPENLNSDFKFLKPKLNASWLSISNPFDTSLEKLNKYKQGKKYSTAIKRWITPTIELTNWGSSGVELSSFMVDPKVKKMIPAKKINPVPINPKMAKNFPHLVVKSPYYLISSLNSNWCCIPVTCSSDSIMIILNVTIWMMMQR